MCWRQYLPQLLGFRKVAPQYWKNVNMCLAPLSITCYHLVTSEIHNHFWNLLCTDTQIKLPSECGAFGTTDPDSSESQVDFQLHGNRSYFNQCDRGSLQRAPLWKHASPWVKSSSNITQVFFHNNLECVCTKGSCGEFLTDDLIQHPCFCL